MTEKNTKLQTDANSVLFTQEKNEKLLKKKKKKYDKDKKYVKLFDNDVNFLEEEKKYVLIKATFVEKRDDIDRSTLYSFDDPFQLLHADVGNLELLRKSVTDPKYCLFFVDLFTSNVYVYPMKSREYIAAKMEFFFIWLYKTGRLNKHNRYVALLKAKSNTSTVVIGDSVAAGLMRYRNVWGKKFNRDTGNCGIGGNKTQNVLWRYNNITLPQSLKYVVINCDTNNLDTDNPGEMPTDLFVWCCSFKNEWNTFKL